MWAMFAKVNDVWRFEGFQEHDEIVNEIEEAVIDDNGEGSFFSVELPA